MKSKVYFTKEITSEKMVEMFKILNKELNKNSNSILINLKSNPDKDLLKYLCNLYLINYYNKYHIYKKLIK